MVCKVIIMWHILGGSRKVPLWGVWLYPAQLKVTKWINLAFMLIQYWKENKKLV